jgi:hypothetical protein
MKNKKYLLLASLTLIFALMPLVSKAGSNHSYSYRSTVFGTGIKDAGHSRYEIVNQKSDFTKNESVYVLTRIFNISKVNEFQFKFQLIKRDGSVKSELYSPLYQPRGNWWAETYAWHNFGKLEKNNYDLKIYININNEGYKYIDHKDLAVDGGYEYDNYNYYDNYYYYEEDEYDSNYFPINNDAKYEYNWSHAGTDVEGYGYYKFKIINQRTEFEKNQNVFILTKLANIKNIREFKIKHELYLHGNDRSTVNESILFRPDRRNWEYNYTWNNFGKLPNGQHTIKVFIKIDNGSYKQIGSISIKVGKESDHIKYNFNWTKTDININYLGDGIYDVANNKSSFSTSENVKVLTKLSGIRGVDSFQVRHELKNTNGGLYKRLDSGVQRPEYRVWENYFSQNDFGKVSAGDYRLETYVKFNDGDFVKINTRDINVKYGNSGTGRQSFRRHDCNDSNDYDDSAYEDEDDASCDDRYRRGAYSDRYNHDYSWTREEDPYRHTTRTAYNYY